LNSRDSDANTADSSFASCKSRWLQAPRNHLNAALRALGGDRATEGKEFARTRPSIKFLCANRSVPASSRWNVRCGRQVEGRLG